MFAIKTTIELNNLIEMQNALLTNVLGKTQDMNTSKYQWNIDLYKHDWTMIKVPVEIEGYGIQEEMNMRIHFVRQYLSKTHSFVKSIISPLSISLEGFWIPFFIPGNMNFIDAVCLTNDKANIHYGVTRMCKAFLEKSIKPNLDCCWTVDDITSAIVWAKVQYGWLPEKVSVDICSAVHSILHYVRKVMWSYMTPKFNKVML